jgi:hypothetical protein
MPLVLIPMVLSLAFATVDSLETDSFVKVNLGPSMNFMSTIALRD